MENKTIARLIVLVLLIAFINLLFFSGIFTKNTTGDVVNVQEDIIKIGFVGMLSGELSVWGQSGLAGVQIALEDVNSKGGINGQKVELIIEDGKASSIESVNAFNKLINIDKVDAIIGSSGSGPTSAATPLAQNSKTPFIAAIASAPHIPEIGDYIFRVYPSDSFQGEYGAEVVYNQLGMKKAAIVYVKNDWGEGIAEVFHSEFEKLGGEVVFKTGVLQEEDDFRTLISKIKKTDAEVLYFVVYPNNALSGMKQIKEMNLGIPVIGGDAMDGAEVVESKHSEDLMYTVGEISFPEDFRQKINSLSGFKNLKPNVAAPTAYDAIKVLLKAIEKVETEPKALRDEIARTKYNGISSPVIEFDSVGSLKQAVFVTKVIKNKEAVLLYD